LLKKVPKQGKLTEQSVCVIIITFNSA